MYKAVVQLQLINQPENGQADIDLTLGLQGEGQTIDKAVLQALVQIKKVTDAIAGVPSGN